MECRPVVLRLVPGQSQLVTQPQIQGETLGHAPVVLHELVEAGLHAALLGQRKGDGFGGRFAQQKVGLRITGDRAREAERSHGEEVAAVQIAPAVGFEPGRHGVFAVRPVEIVFDLEGFVLELGIDAGVAAQRQRRAGDGDVRRNRDAIQHREVAAEVVQREAIFHLIFRTETVVGEAELIHQVRRHRPRVGCGGGLHARPVEDGFIGGHVAGDADLSGVVMVIPARDHVPGV